MKNRIKVSPSSRLPGKTPTRQPEFLAILGARRHVELCPAIQCGNFHIAAQYGLPDGNLQIVIDIAASDVEFRMLLELDSQV